MRDDGRLRLAVVSDTHGSPHPALQQQLSALAPDAILHAGDVGARSVLKALRSLAPVVAVRGNVDPPAPDLPDVVIFSVEGASWTLRILLTHYALAGPKLLADVVRHAKQRQADIVVCGHSHVPFMGTDRGLTVFNPGSAGPRRFRLPIVFGVFEVGQDGLQMRHVDCETGARWAPPR